jgi:hypothetical protein
MSIKSKDFGGNKQLEDKTDSFKSANSLENYELKELLDCMLKELKEIKKQLIKINQ